jgi:hypothetical protein
VGLGLLCPAFGEERAREMSGTDFSPSRVAINQRRYVNNVFFKYRWANETRGRKKKDLSILPERKEVHRNQVSVLRAGGQIGMTKRKKVYRTGGRNVTGEENYDYAQPLIGANNKTSREMNSLQFYLVRDHGRGSSSNVISRLASIPLLILTSDGGDESNPFPADAAGNTKVAKICPGAGSIIIRS